MEDLECQDLWPASRVASLHQKHTHKGFGLTLFFVVRVPLHAFAFVYFLSFFGRVEWPVLTDGRMKGSARNLGAH